MAIIYQFKTKTPTTTDTKDVSSREYHEALTIQHCRELVDEYRKTGRWDFVCEEKMVQVVHLLSSIVIHLTTETGANQNGTSNTR